MFLPDGKSFLRGQTLHDLETLKERDRRQFNLNLKFDFGSRLSPEGKYIADANVLGEARIKKLDLPAVILTL